MAEDLFTRTVDTVCPNCETDVMHWIHYARSGSGAVSRPPSEDSADATYRVDKKLNRKIFIHTGSVTDLECDVVLIGANTNLDMKEEWLVKEIAGEEIVAEAKSLGPKEEGDVVETDGYELPASSVFHAVIPTAGPTPDKETVPETNEMAILETCYTNALNLMVEKGYRSIGMSCLGTIAGKLSRLRARAAELALKTLREWMEVNRDALDIVILCHFEKYEGSIHRYFPVN